MMPPNLPDKPTLLWDGECRFCAHWIRRWEKLVGNAVVYRQFKEALPEFPQVREEDCVKAVQLILSDGRVLSAAHAVLTSLALGGRGKRILKLYEKSVAFRRCTEAAYRFVAANRSRLPRL
ncbi:MAG: DCC1-like thiol-disulfide oxidoreductase family protein [Pontiella sp.]